MTMTAEPERYPAFYVIFTLLNAIRRGIERKHLWREFRRQKIALQPRLAFWLALCRQARLIEVDTGSGVQQVRVTRQARAWLNKMPEEQALALLDAWQNAPKNHKARQFRRKLLWKLQHEKPLTPKDQKAIGGLEALGVYQNGKLTAWGRYFLQGKGELATPKAAVTCRIHQDQFVASLPQHVDLLWELERHLRPARPAVYPLHRRALRSLQGDPQDLIALLERGLQQPLPEEIRARILDQPTLRVMEGIIIEFSHPAELTRLRRQPNFRRHIAQILSPRHVIVSTQHGSPIVSMLRRRGVHVSFHEEPEEIQKKRTHFQRQELLQPVGRSVPRLEVLTQYLQLQQALDVLYRTPGYPAERRRITPLMIEQRGEHTYVIAYCQTRRARRTFRLDRIEIPGTW